jgi:hypothetical protein
MHAPALAPAGKCLSVRGDVHLQLGLCRVALCRAFARFSRFLGMLRSVTCNGVTSNAQTAATTTVAKANTRGYACVNVDQVLLLVEGARGGGWGGGVGGERPPSPCYRRVSRVRAAQGAQLIAVTTFCPARVVQDPTDCLNLLSTPVVAEMAKSHFDCSTMTGMEVCDMGARSSGGGGGERGLHDNVSHPAGRGLIAAIALCCPHTCAQAWGVPLSVRWSRTLCAVCVFAAACVCVLAAGKR